MYSYGENRTEKHLDNKFSARNYPKQILNTRNFRPTSLQFAPLEMCKEMCKEIKKGLSCTRQNNLSLALMMLISLLKSDVEEFNVR